MKTLIRITEKDNVAVALHPVHAGETLDADGVSVTAREDVPQGHKIALAPIRTGEAVVKYGCAIGYAQQDIAAGQ